MTAMLPEFVVSEGKQAETISNVVD
jgi:hypothetical protein